ncbi:hexokinase-3 [Quercus suber]|uniref:Phosphotransferase n=1 Tax=Quercus suber TaxID=58331 RepID=A0AAW0KX56_QUESU
METPHLPTAENPTSQTLNPKISTVNPWHRQAHNLWHRQSLLSFLPSATVAIPSVLRWHGLECMRFSLLEIYEHAMAWHARINHDFGCVSFSWLRVHERVMASMRGFRVWLYFFVGCSQMVGREVSECLEQAMARKGLNMQVAALATNIDLRRYKCLLFGADRCIIRCQGVLTTSGGMVSFLCVSRQTSSDSLFDELIYFAIYLLKLTHPYLHQSSHLPRTSYDIELDVQMIRTPLMAEIHEDDSPELTEVARILKDTLEIPDVPLKVRKLVVKVCDVVTRRAARLAAAGIVGILKKIGQDGSGGITGGRSRSDIKMKRTVVAIEGGLFTSYTMFREYLHEAMIEILGEEAAQHVILMVTEDRAGVN